MLLKRVSTAATTRSSTVRMFALGIALLAASAVSVSAQPKINDAQIAAIAVAANQVDDAG